MFRSFGRIGRNMMLGLTATGMMLMTGAATAQAQDREAAGNRMLAGVPAQEVINILTENKIQAQRITRPGNDPMIVAVLPSGGKFLVFLQNCGNNGVNCQVVLYSAIFTGPELPLSDFNTFNARYAFGKAFQGKEKEMWIQHAVSVAGGIRRGAVEENMFLFVQLAGYFANFLAERMTSVSASLDKPADKKSEAITNIAGELPGNSTLASVGKAADKHPEIINKVSKGSLKAWKTK